MLIISSLFFGASMAVIFFNSRADISSNESVWFLAGLFMMIALSTFLKGVFSEKRLHEQSHHSLP